MGRNGRRRKNRRARKRPSPVQRTPSGPLQRRSPRPHLWMALAVVAVAVVALAVILRPRGDSPPAAIPIPLLGGTEGVDPLVVEAIEEAVADVRRDPADGALFGFLGKVYQAHEYHALARRCYEIAAALDSTRADWPYYLGVYAERQGRTEDAISLLGRSIELDPGYSRTYLRLGEMRLVVGDLDGSESAFRRYVGREGAEGWGHVGLGRVAWRRNRLDEAAAHFETALGLDRRAGQAAYLLATIYRLLGREEEAALLLSEVVASAAPVRPPDPRLSELLRLSAGLQGLVYRANRLLEAGSLEEAETLYRQILELDPEHYTALANLGNVLGRQDRTEEALSLLRRAVTVDPNHPHAHYGLALVFLSRGQMSMAEAELETVLSLDPNDANAAGLLGRLEARY